MPAKQLFTTLFHEGSLDDPALVAQLDAACRALAQEDELGRKMARAAFLTGYRGYTSYDSIPDLGARDPSFAELAERLQPHADRFAEECAFDLGGKRLKLGRMWVNLLQPGGAHGSHMHPHAVLSGTVYIAVPPGTGALKLEDPRMPMYMAAPPRRADAPEMLRKYIYAKPGPGTVFLWESWLRHEVVPSTAPGDRISISFNYRQ
jgi:uncharacterized protein (TIGR02466 family)